MGTDRDVARAEAAADAVQADPARAAELADEVLAATDASVEARVVASWARGLASRERGRLEESRDWFGRAVELADTESLTARAGSVRVSLALTLANLGDLDAAIAEIARARPDVTGIDRARLDQQEALIRQRQGQLDEARTIYRRALAAAGDDRLLECRVLSNLGVLEGYAGRVDVGIALLTDAMARAAEIEQQLLEARAAHNLGFMEGRRGDVPAGLRWLDRADELYARIDGSDNDRIILEADRAGLLLDGGLHRDAVDQSEAALGRLGTRDESIDRAELTLLHARALMADDQAIRAAEVAREAAAGFAAQTRDVWRWVAEVFALECASHDADTAPAWTDAAAAADALRAAGAISDSLRARVLAVRLAGESGDVDSARLQLAALPEPRGLPNAADRAALWRAVAEARGADSDHRGARRALRAGLRAVDDYQSRFGSFEMRARSVEAGAAMAAHGLRLALADGRPTEMLAWLESRRASALLHPPADAPADGRLSDVLAELRMVEAQEAASRGEDSIDRDRRRSLEDEVRRLTRSVSGGTAGAMEARGDLRRLPDVLGDRLLCAYFRLGDDLHLLTQHEGRTRHFPLGPLAPVTAEIEHIAFAIQRLARTRASAASTAAAETSLDAATAMLDELLFGPLAELGEHGDLVVVPTGPLHGLPWRSLDRCRRHHAVVAPSARVWLEAATSTFDGAVGTTAVIAGPDLPGARAEALDLRTALRDPVVLLDDHATTGAVRDALSRCHTAHIAAHGRFRVDNPLFSSLRLADGAFTTYELESISPFPALFVLPACQAAATAVYQGDEILGFSAALLALGAHAVVAPVNPVSDEATRSLMVDFHAALAHGEAPARALSTATAGVADESAPARAAAASFMVVGAG